MKVIPENLLKLMSKEDRPKGSAGRTVAETMERGEVIVERELQNQVMNLLRQRGIAFIHPSMKKRPQLRVGWVDFSFAFLGVPHAWEVKTPKGKLRPEQEQMAIELQNDVNGWRYAVIRSVQQAKDILDAEAAK